MTGNRCPFSSDHTDITEFDMIDPHARACPHSYYKWIQGDLIRRVYGAPKEKSFYVVHRYEDVKFALTNNKLFSSAILPTRRSPFLALMDGTDHLRQREIANKIFQIDHPDFPKAAIQKFIEDVSQSLVSKMQVELLKDWATPIPLASLCLIFGIDPSVKMTRQLHEWAIIINRSLFVLGGTGQRRRERPTLTEKLSITFSLLRNISKIRKVKRSVGEEGWLVLKKMFLPMKTEFENPRPDFSFVPQAIEALLDLMILFNDALENEKNKSHGMGVLRQAVAEDKLLKVEAIMLCSFVLFAGYETSVSLLSNSVYHLSKHPELFKQLKDNPDSIEIFIEESLRFYTPVGRFLRRANEDVTIGEQTIPKGAMIITMLGAANTDPDRFDESFSFQSSRKKNQHMSFGKGIHFCVGAPLARLQANLALTSLIKAATQLLLDDTQELKMVTDRDNGILRLEELKMRIL